MIKIRQIQFFLSVIQFKSFIKAAESLNVSQPGVSKAIRELEQVLKTQQKVIYFKKENIKVCIRYSLLSVILPMTPFLHENHNFYINFTLGEDIT